MGVSLLTIPIYIRLVGDARYGVLAIVWAFLGYFGMFDLGLGRATAQRIAALGDRPAQLIASTFWTALAMNGALGVVGGLLVWPVSNYFFGHELNINDELRSELCVGSSLADVCGAFDDVVRRRCGCASGARAIRELNIISVASSVLLQTLPFWSLGAWPRLGVAGALCHSDKVVLACGDCFGAVRFTCFRLTRRHFRARTQRVCSCLAAG